MRQFLISTAIFIVLPSNKKIHHLEKVTIHYAREKWKISILMHFYDENV
jgi:hypothetical protein